MNNPFDMSVARRFLGLEGRPPTLPPYITPAWGWRQWLKLFALLVLPAFCLIYGFFYALTTPYLIMFFAAPLGIMALIVIWALPDMDRAPTRTMEKLFFAFFVSLILWPNYIAIALPGLPWITLLRLTGIPMALLLLICVSTSAPFRRQLTDILQTTPIVWKLLIGFVAVQFLTIGLSSTPTQSLQKVIVAQTNWTAIFFVACYVFRTPGKVDRYIHVLWFVAVVICGIGLWEGAIQKVPWQGHIPSFFKIDEAQVMLDSMYRGRAYRVKTIHSTPLGLGEFLALTTPFLLHFIIGKFPIAMRVGAALSLVLFLRVIHSTDSRLGMVGVLLSILLYVLAWGIIRWRRHKADMLGPLVVLAYPAFFTALMGLTFVSRRIEIMVWGSQATEGSNLAREQQLALGVPKMLKNPLGYGAGQGADTVGWFSGTFLSIDNYYLAMVIEYGVIGFILYFALIMYIGWVAARNGLFFNSSKDKEIDYLIPLGIAMAVFFVIKSVFSQQDNHPLIFIMMGMIVALVYRNSGEGNSRVGQG
jgi:hypothetical protein